MPRYVLKLSARIDKDADLRFLRLSDRFETHGVSLRNSVVRFIGGRINSDLFLQRRERRRFEFRVCEYRWQPIMGRECC